MEWAHTMIKISNKKNNNEKIIIKDEINRYSLIKNDCRLRIFEKYEYFFSCASKHTLCSHGWCLFIFFAQYQDFILKSLRAALLTTKEATESAYTILCIYINQYRGYWEEQRNKYSISFLTVFKWTLCCRSVLQLNAIRMNFIAAKVRTVHWYFVDEFVVSRSFLIIKCICIFLLRQIAFFGFFQNADKRCDTELWIFS